MPVRHRYLFDFFFLGGECKPVPIRHLGHLLVFVNDETDFHYEFCEGNGF